MAYAKRDQAIAWVGNQRHARIAHQGNLAALFELDQQFRGARQLIVLVIADQRPIDFVVVQQFLCVASVFAGDEINFFENAQGAQRYILPVSARVIIF